MANRHLLAVNQLEKFQVWLMLNGWQIEKPKGKYEVLRARIETELNPLIVYRRLKDNLVHLSVSDYNARIVEMFVNNVDYSPKQTKCLQTQTKTELAPASDQQVKYVDFKVDIKGVPYTIKLAKDFIINSDVLCDGVTNTETKEIVLSKQMDSAQVERVIAHEITHALLYECGLVTFYSNEVLIDWIATHAQKIVELSAQVKDISKLPAN